MARAMKDSGIPWIGEIPETWSKEKVIRIFQTIGSGTTPKSDDETYFEGNIKWIQSGDINGGLLTHSKSSVSSEALQRFSALKVYSAPYIVIAMYGASIGNMSVSMIDGCVNQACCVLGDTKQNLQYFFYVLKCSKDYLSWKSVGGGQPNISQETIKQLWLPLPSIEEQTEIVKTLDTECARIDAVMEQTRASIEEYKKLKQSIITEAVTKGIRPNRPMKDSGIDWVKEIPADWNSIHPKALFSQRKEKAIAGERQLTASQQYGVVFQDEYMEKTGAKVVTVEKDFDILKHVEQGDFVISMRSFQGGLEYSTNTGSISSAYVMLIPNLKYVFPRFFRWLLKSPIYINALQSTSNMVRDGQAMRYSNFAQVRLYTVPLDEQEEIADFLDKECAAIDSLVEQKEAFLSEMESYKKSLIYEYVTGKKEVV